MAPVPDHCIRVTFKYSKREIKYGYFVSVFQSFRLSVSYFLNIESWFSGKESAYGRNGFSILEKAKNVILHKNTLFALLIAHPQIYVPKQ